jgi:hypothetical protein
MQMTLIFVSLGIGIAIGYVHPLSPRGVKAAHTITMAGLFILLASMGAQLGSNEKVLADLSEMGLQAVVLAGCSVLGSVALVYLARDFICRGLEERMAGWRRRGRQ